MAAEEDIVYQHFKELWNHLNEDGKQSLVSQGIIPFFNGISWNGRVVFTVISHFFSTGIFDLLDAKENLFEEDVVEVIHHEQRLDTPGEPVVETSCDDSSQEVVILNDDLVSYKQRVFHIIITYERTEHFPTKSLIPSILDLYLCDVDILKDLLQVDSFFLFRKAVWNGFIDWINITLDYALRVDNSTGIFLDEMLMTTRCVYEAAANGQDEVVNFILSCLSRLDHFEKYLLMGESESQPSGSPLHVAVGNNDLAVCCVLLRHASEQSLLLKMFTVVDELNRTVLEIVTSNTSSRVQTALLNAYSEISG